MNRLTVAIPTLGERPDWLALNIESILRQRIGIDLVVVAPRGVHDALRTQLPEGTTVLNDPGSGLTAAINHGMRHASTPYVSWLGDDDVLIPDTAHRMVALMDRHPEAPFGYGRMILFNADGSYHLTVRPGRFAPILVTTVRNFLPQQGTLFRRSAMEQVGWADESLKFAMDLDLWLRLRRLGRPAYLPERVGAFRYHTGGLTLGNPASQAEALEVRVNNAGRLHGTLIRGGHAPLGFLTRVLYKAGVGRYDVSAEDTESMVGITPRA